MSPPGSSAAPATRTRTRSANSWRWPGAFDLTRNGVGIDRRPPAGSRRDEFPPCPLCRCGASSVRTRTVMQTPNTYRGGPDASGHFGLYGGRYVAETLMPLILAVEQAYNAAKADPNFSAELAHS